MDVLFLFKVMDLKQKGVLFSSPAPVLKKHKPRIQEQKVNSVLPPVPVPEAAISKVGAVENDIHEEESMLTFFESIFILL